MKIKYLIPLVAFFSMFLLPSSFAQDGAGADRYRLSYRTDPATSIVIGWDQVNGGDATVYYGTTDAGTVIANYTNSQEVDKVSNTHGMNSRFVRLKDLTPNTNYYFVLDNGTPGVRYWFKTQPDSPEQMSIIAGGDTRSDHGVRRNGFTLVQKLSPNLVYFGGDFTNTASDASWEKWLDDWQLTIRGNGKMTPIVGATGNHENRGDVKDIFDGPNADGGNNNEYYSLGFAGNMWKAYVLNTEITAGGDQEDWFEADLIASQDYTYRTAIYHRPMRPHTKWKAEYNNGYNAWAQHIYDYKVQLVVESDAHTGKSTEKIMPCNGGAGCDEDFVEDEDGTVYVGEGCWGAPLYKDDDSKDWTKCYSEFDQIRWIFISPTQIEIQVIKIGTSGGSGWVAEADRFATPDGLDIWDCDGGSIIIPAPDGGPLTLSGSATEETCYGDCQGIATMTISGGSSPYDYNWSNGESGTDVNVGNHSTAANLCQGTYTVTVTDDAGASETAEFVVGGPNAITITESITDASGCGISCDGAINITTAGGVTGPIDETFTDNTGGDAIGGAGDHLETTFDNVVSGMTMALTDENTIQEVCVNFSNLTSNGAGDLRLYILNPCGERTFLKWYPDGGTGNAVNKDICFRVDQGSAIKDGDVNADAGPWIPRTLFNVEDGPLTGCDPNGTWQLMVTNRSSADAAGLATVNNWTLTLQNVISTVGISWTGPSGFTSTSEDLSALCTGTYVVTVTDNNSCTQTKSIDVGCPVGIKDASKVRDRIYQEGRGSLRIQTSKSIIGVTVYSVDGKNVYTGGARTRAIDMSKERAGVYLVKVQTNQGNFVNKVIIEK